MIDVNKRVYTGLTIYDSINEQFRNISEESFYLIAPDDRFLPFMFMRDASENDLLNIKVRDLDNNLIITIPQGNIPRKILKNELLSKDWFIYYGAVIPGMSLPCDDYYLEIEDAGGNFWYSEVFRPFSQAQLNEFVKLEFTNSHNIENLIYQDGFVNRLYFDTFIGQPEPGIEEEGQNDGEGNFIPDFQRSFLTHNFKLDLIPSFLVRVLSQIDLHDQISITYQGHNFDFAKDFEFAGTWVNESFFQADIKFKTTDLINNNCADNTIFYELGTTPAENEAPQLLNFVTTGQFKEGKSVSVSFLYFDKEGDAPGQHLFQWFRYDNALGGNPVLLIGETFSNYILRSGDVGKYVGCEGTPIALTGTSPGVKVRSPLKLVEADSVTGENIISIIDNGTSEPLFSGGIVKFRVGSEVPLTASGSVKVKISGTGIVNEEKTVNLFIGSTFVEGVFSPVINLLSSQQTAKIEIIDAPIGIQISDRDVFYVTVKSLFG